MPQSRKKPSFSTTFGERLRQCHGDLELGMNGLFKLCFSGVHLLDSQMIAFEDIMKRV